MFKVFEMHCLQGERDKTSERNCISKDMEFFVYPTNISFGCGTFIIAICKLNEF